MTKNELDLIEDWIKYHGYIFGVENIHILDGSDDYRIKRIYEKYIPMGLNIHYSSAGLNDLAQELTELMHAYKGKNNFLIKLDTDEFLAYSNHFRRIKKQLINNYENNNKVSKIYGILLNNLSLLLSGTRFLHIDNFANFLKSLPITEQRYKASLTTWSIPQYNQVSNICKDIIIFTPLQYTMIKSFFHSESFVSVDLGCHNGKSLNNDGFIETGLTIIHYHSVSVEDSARRAKQVLVSHNYIKNEDSIEDQRQKLQSVRAQGNVNSYHKIDLYLKYIEWKRGEVSFDPEILNIYNPYYKSTSSFKRMTLVRNTLHKINKKGIYSQ